MGTLMPKSPSGSSAQGGLVAITSLLAKDTARSPRYLSLCFAQPSGPLSPSSSLPCRAFPVQNGSSVCHRPKQTGCPGPPWAALRPREPPC